MKHNKHQREFWKANLKLICGCLMVWAIFPFGFGIIFVESLNQYQMGGYPLGFWFAHQGSIYAFIALIAFYNWKVEKLEAAFLASSPGEAMTDEGSVQEGESK